MPHRAVAQASAAPMQFEVVSIKPNVTGPRMMSEGYPRDTFEQDYISLPDLIVNAYGLKREYQVLGLPEWAKSAHYDVVAKVGGADVAAMQKVGYYAMNRMLQPVLQDRFGLHSHWEKRVLPTYTLTLAKKGSALKEGTAADNKVITMGELSFGAQGFVITPDRLLISRAAPISMLVEHLQGEMKTVVVDGTGLKGNYDYQMQLPHASEGGGPAHMQPDESIQGSLYQIGLRLVESKTELPVLVVDAIQQPSAN
jgi:uncharacterized protein (TIGR03435 family)